MTPIDPVAAITSISHQILRHVVTVVVQSSHDMTAAGVLFNGTGLLIGATGRRFVVTADHVLRAASREGRIPVILGERGKNVSGWRIIDRDEQLDIAVVEIPQTFDLNYLSRQCFVPAWPLPRARRGDSAIVVGFPGSRRKASEQTLDQGAVTVADFVVSSSDRRFVIADEEDERLPPGRPPQSAGGMSGAPIFIARQDLAPSWAGILIAGSDTTEQLFAAHADFVLPSGELDRSRMA